jgi:hypothetical protein
MLGVTGVRASPWTIGLNRRAKTGRRKFSMAGQDLTWVLFPLAALVCPALASLPSAIVAFLGARYPPAT